MSGLRAPSRSVGKLPYSTASIVNWLPVISRGIIPLRPRVSNLESEFLPYSHSFFADFRVPISRRGSPLHSAEVVGAGYCTAGSGSVKGREENSWVVLARRDEPGVAAFPDLEDLAVQFLLRQS